MSPQDRQRPTAEGEVVLHGIRLRSHHLLSTEVLGRDISQILEIMVDHQRQMEEAAVERAVISLTLFGLIDLAPGSLSKKMTILYRSPSMSP